MFRNEIDQGWKIKNIVIEDGFISPIITGRHVQWPKIAPTDLPPQDAFYLTFQNLAIHHGMEALGYIYADFSTGNVGLINTFNSNCN